MLMTIATALQRLQTAVLRDDLADRYIDFLNEAIRHVATRHSFIEMKTSAALTIPAGSRSAVLPELFKEFQNGRHPVVANLPPDDSDSSSGSDSGDSETQPIPVYTRQELERLPPSFRPVPHLTFFQENRQWVLKLPEKALVSLSLTAYIFTFPAEILDESGDSSDSGDSDDSAPLLQQYPELVLEKAMAIAFQSISDPVWQDHDRLFEQLLPDAITHDISRSEPVPQPEKE